MLLHITKPTDWLEVVRKEREFQKSGETRWLKRYTRAAYDVIKAGGAEARSMERDYVGAEHLLLGLLKPYDGSANAVLRKAGLTHDSVQSEVIARIRAKGLFYEGMAIPFTPRMKRICLSAQNLAQSREGSLVEPEDLLLALLDESGGLPHELINKFNVDVTALRVHLQKPEV